MPRAYTVVFTSGTIAAASGDYDLFEVVPADDKPCEIYGLELYVTSELGDAADEWCAIQIVRGNTTSSNGTATTPQPTSAIDVAAGFVAETVGTTPATAGTSVTLWAGGVNVRAGLEKWFPQGSGLWVSQAATGLYVRMSSTVADDVTMSGTLWVNEYP